MQLGQSASFEGQNSSTECDLAGGGMSAYSGTGYDRWAYEQSAPGANDTALNKLQHKYWVAKQATTDPSTLLSKSNTKFLFRYKTRSSWIKIRTYKNPRLKLGM